jgi:hypothetical protein
MAFPPRQLPCCKNFSTGNERSHPQERYRPRPPSPRREGRDGHCQLSRAANQRRPSPGDSPQTRTRAAGKADVPNRKTANTTVDSHRRRQHGRRHRRGNGHAVPTRRRPGPSVRGAQTSHRRHQLRRGPPEVQRPKGHLGAVDPLAEEIGSGQEAAGEEPGRPELAARILQIRRSERDRTVGAKCD